MKFMVNTMVMVIVKAIVTVMFIAAVIERIEELHLC